MNMQKSKLLNSLVAVVLLSGASITASQAAGQSDKMAAPVGLSANAGVSDDSIAASAKAALSSDAQSATLPINVAVKKGVVVLTGSIPSAEAGDHAVQLIASVAGVKEVKNDLKVKAAG